MRTNECELDEEILQVVFNIACTFVERKSSPDTPLEKKGVSNCGIVTNVHALKSLILDWRIWQVGSKMDHHSIFKKQQVSMI